MTPNDDPREPEIPPSLQRDLRAVFGRRVDVPSSFDAALSAAGRRRPRPVLWPMAAAAALVLLGLAWSQWRHPGGPLDVRADFDHDGKVDVLDAYRLALALRRTEPVPVAFDLDGDGVVDTRDVDRIAHAAVAGSGV